MAFAALLCTPFRVTREGSQLIHDCNPGVRCDVLYSGLESEGRL